MTKITKSILLVFIALTIAAVGQRITRSSIYASDYGDRNSTTLNSVLSKLGTKETELVLDGGVWTITNDVTFASNICVRFEQGCWMNVYTGKTVTFNSGDLLASDKHQKLFDGYGVVTGNARFLLSQDEWTTNAWQVPGTGDIEQVSFWQLWMTNAYPLLDTNYTDDITTGNITNSITNIWPNLDTNGFVTYASMSGMYPVYVDTNTVSVTNGEGYCYDTYFCMTSAVSLDLPVTAFASATGFAYIYIDYDASTFPNAVTLYASTNAPMKVNEPMGWYCTTSSQDRVVAATPIHLNRLCIAQWNEADCVQSNVFELESTLTGSPMWTNCSDRSASSVLPINASHLYVEMHGDDTTPAVLHLAAARKELRDLTGTPLAASIYPYDVRRSGYRKVNGTDWMPLGPSRDIYIHGEGVDDGWEVWVRGWRIYR